MFIPYFYRISQTRARLPLQRRGKIILCAGRLLCAISFRSAIRSHTIRHNVLRRDNITTGSCIVLRLFFLRHLADARDDTSAFSEVNELNALCGTSHHTAVAHGQTNVARPMTLTSESFKRIVMPFLLIIIRSFSSVTDFMATTFPVFSVMLIVFTPFPPRFVTR